MLLVTGGMCPDVGVAGFTLGGGYSMLTRKYGLAIDNVISMRMVTANGSMMVFINESGIVTEFIFKTRALLLIATILNMRS